MAVKSKIKLDELEMAIAHIKSISDDVTVQLHTADNGIKVIIEATDKLSRSIAVTIFDTEADFLPTITSTERLTKNPLAR